MRFEERELKPYSEPALGSELVQGVVYFGVSYRDDEMLIPYMEPLVFVGKDIDSQSTGEVYFQDFDSYQRGIRHNTEGDATLYAVPEDKLGHIFRYECALDELMRCALRRRKIRVDQNPNGCL